MNKDVFKKEAFNFADLKGEVLADIQISKDKDFILFVTFGEPILMTANNNGICEPYYVGASYAGYKKYIMYHEQNCCEGVFLESISDNFKGILIGQKILSAEVSEITKDTGSGEDIGLFTFYKLATSKGYVDIRWYGESNGYYAVDVNFERLKKQQRIEKFWTIDNEVTRQLLEDCYLID